MARCDRKDEAVRVLVHAWRSQRRRTAAPSDNGAIACGNPPARGLILCGRARGQRELLTARIFFRTTLSNKIVVRYCSIIACKLRVWSALARGRLVLALPC